MSHSIPLQETNPNLETTKSVEVQDEMGQDPPNDPMDTQEETTSLTA
jgi:hypothetical protein